MQASEFVRQTYGNRPYFSFIDKTHGWLMPYSKPEGMGLIYNSHPFYVGPHFENELEGIMAVTVQVKEGGDGERGLG